SSRINVVGIGSNCGRHYAASFSFLGRGITRLRVLTISSGRKAVNTPKGLGKKPSTHVVPVTLFCTYRSNRIHELGVPLSATSCSRLTSVRTDVRGSLIDSGTSQVVLTCQCLGHGVRFGGSFFSRFTDTTRFRPWQPLPVPERLPEPLSVACPCP